MLSLLLTLNKPARVTTTKMFFVFISLISIFINSTVKADSLTTFEITQSTLSAIPHCLHYKITGTCFWQSCDNGICSITATPKVDHYLPDAVVSVYRKTNSNPWDYARKLIDSEAKLAGDAELKRKVGFELGVGNESSGSTHDQNTHFKEVDIIGNPAIVFFTKHSKVFLPSEAQPFVPYYLSLADAYLWRSPLVEAGLYPQFLVPGVHIVGSLIDNWGSIYPRTGFIEQPADGKAAAVIAQRAASIATHASLHIYKTLASGACGEHCKVDPANENDKNTKWQMIYPSSENTCMMFGQNDLDQPHSWGNDLAEKGNGNYVWILWRRYRGCVPGDGKYVGQIDF